ncbi:MAG TPA: glycoside hydrolase family 9 protein [Candidatus Limnocylindrales bacterium]|nr:glycoside hydrolase family 9 protein [Candidatus Limnocylindrales bacterium]
MTTQFFRLGAALARRSFVTVAFTTALLALLPVHRAAAVEATSSIRLNTVGYPPDAVKQASVALPCTNFAVIRVADGATVFQGAATGPVSDPDTREQLYTADFSKLGQPGDYQLDVPGVGRSAPFHVGPNVYREPYYLVMRGFYLWRCGTAVHATYQGTTFAHDICHTNDAWLDFVGGGHAQKDGTKGWHDAGDYNKYVVNAGVTVGVMFRAWEDFGPQIKAVRLDLPESGGPLPDYLAEIKWELDWLLTMQAPDGSVYHKLSTTRFGGFAPPEFETAERYFTPWGSEATADFVGIMAQAARIYRPYDPAFANRCLLAAEKSYRFLQAHPEYHHADQTGFSTGAYEINEPNHRLGGVPENRLWAAAEIWETTGDTNALRDLENRIRSVQGKVDSDFDWDEVKDLGLITYLFSEQAGRNPALVNLVRSNLLATADEIVQTRNHDAYARPMGSHYFWGCNGAVARQTVILMAADRATHRKILRLSSRNVYRDTCLDALNHLFGRNYYGRSFVTGLGFEPPQHPHDRRDTGEYLNHPWPGYLVGGPHPRATDWHDDQADFRVDEIAINWNAALVYALAACLND